MRFAAIIVAGSFAGAAMTGPATAGTSAVERDWPIEIRLATLALRGTSPYLAIERMSKEWERISGGRVRLVMYPDYHQGEAAMVDKLGIKALDAAVMSNVGLSQIDAGVTCLVRLPMAFRSYAEVDHVQQLMEPALKQRLLKRGYVMLTVTDIGWVWLFSRDPVMFPDDLKRQKIFVWSGDTQQVDLIKKAGFDPVALETADILPGLSSGMIDAVHTTPAYANGAQLYAATRHLLQLNWAPLVGGAVIRRDVWERIPPELRPSLLKAAQRMGQEVKQASRDENEAAVKAMQRKHGLQVHAVTREAEQAWISAAERTYSDIRGGIVPEDLYDRVIAVLKEYRAGGKSQ